ncbi:hypothetical protein HMPREF3204_00069 [Gardnerella pickettii]|nr:hypothetical protein HMPREF3204_00069 [Gardnerella pickettii]
MRQELASPPTHKTGSRARLSKKYRSRGLAALTSSPRRSSASALSGSARQIAFARYALSAPAGWRACEERNTQTSRNNK